VALRLTSGRNLYPPLVLKPHICLSITTLSNLLFQNQKGTVVKSSAEFMNCRLK